MFLRFIVNVWRPWIYDLSQKLGDLAHNPSYTISISEEGFWSVQLGKPNDDKDVE